MRAELHLASRAKACICHCATNDLGYRVIQGHIGFRDITSNAGESNGQLYTSRNYEIEFREDSKTVHQGTPLDWTDFFFRRFPFDSFWWLNYIFFAKRKIQPCSLVGPLISQLVVSLSRATQI